MTQTAVEWLINQIHKKQYGDYPNLTFENIFKEAKEMEKQQILDAFSRGAAEGLFGDGASNKEQYYNETYKNNI